MDLYTLESQRFDVQYKLEQLKRELHETDLWKQIQEYETKLKEYEDHEAKMKDELLNKMLDSNIKTLTIEWQLKATVKKNPWSVEIMDESEIEEKYFKIKKEINKSEIRKALLSWSFVPWATLKESYSLVITPVN